MQKIIVILALISLPMVGGNRMGKMREEAHTILSKNIASPRNDHERQYYNTLRTASDSFWFQILNTDNIPNDKRPEKYKEAHAQQRLAEESPAKEKLRALNESNQIDEARRDELYNLVEAESITEIEKALGNDYNKLFGVPDDPKDVPPLCCIQ